MRGTLYLAAGMAMLMTGLPLEAQDIARIGTQLARNETELDRVIGRDARTIIQLLGNPAQDVREGSARRLQFASQACILDVYLYPPAEGRTPIAVYTAARVPDGRDAERNSCISALRLAR